MEQNFCIMDLKEEFIAEIKQLEKKISSETGSEFNIITYEGHSHKKLKIAAKVV